MRRGKTPKLQLAHDMISFVPLDDTHIPLNCCCLPLLLFMIISCTHQTAVFFNSPLFNFVPDSDISWSPLLPPAIISTTEHFLPTRQALGPTSRAVHAAAWRGKGEGTSWKLPARPGNKAAAQNKAKQQLQVAVPPANDGLILDTFSQALPFVVVVSPVACSSSRRCGVLRGWRTRETDE